MSQIFNNPYTRLTGRFDSYVLNKLSFLGLIKEEILLTIIILILISILLLIAYLITNQFNLFRNVSAFTKLINHGLANLNDVSLVTVTLIIFFFVNLYSILNPIQVHYSSFLAWIMILVVFIVVVIPFYILKNYGAYYLAFLRGSGSKKSFLWELFNDLVGVFSFFVRINIQLIRLLIATVFFAIVVEYWEASGSYLYSSQLNIEILNWFDYCVYFSSLIWFILLRVLYEVGHFWLLFFIQTTAFSMIIILLVQFLYVCYLIDKLEAYFKKNTKNKEIIINNK